MPPAFHIKKRLPSGKTQLGVNKRNLANATEHKQSWRRIVQTGINFMANKYKGISKRSAKRKLGISYKRRPYRRALEDIEDFNAK